MKKQKNILLSYRVQRFDAEIVDRIVKYKNDKIYLVVQDEFEKNFIDSLIKLTKKLKNLNTNINIITATYFIKGELNMDLSEFIIETNPPYQYPKGTNTRKKLYIDILYRMWELNASKISLVCPEAILEKGVSNKMYPIVEKYATHINFDVSFDISQSVVEITLDRNKDSEKIKVQENNIIKIFDNFSKVDREENLLLRSIINKVSYKENNKEKLKIISSNGKNGVANKFLKVEKTEEHYIPVYCNTKKDRIKYTSIDADKKCKALKNVAVVPYSGDYKEGILNIKERVNQLFFLYFFKDINEFNNFKKYMESKLITYCVINYKIRIKKDAAFNFLTQITKVDLSRSYSDKELYDFFNISKEEIEEIEEWYKEWIK